MIKAIYQKTVPEKLRLQLHISLRKLKSVTLSGDRFYCPCCTKSFSKFLSKGNGLELRPNAVCANCGSLERTRLLYLHLKNETAIFEGKPTILHFAPEDILKSKLIANPNYTDADINPNFARVQMDITDIKFENSYFDFIICSHVLEHIPDEKKALAELYRVLKHGGELFFMSLINPEAAETFEDPQAVLPQQRLEAYGEKDLQRLYGADFAQRIRFSEVVVEQIDYRTHFSGDERRRMSLGDGSREIIYKVVKM